MSNGGLVFDSGAAPDWDRAIAARHERGARQCPVQLHRAFCWVLPYGFGPEKGNPAARGVALMPVSRDAMLGSYVQLQLVRIYLLVREPEKALDQLESLLKIPYYLSPGWLKIDPNFAPLRGNPRFERLIGEG